MRKSEEEKVFLTELNVAFSSEACKRKEVNLQ
jgi:hypothetical protein